MNDSIINDLTITETIRDCMEELQSISEDEVSEDALESMNCVIEELEFLCCDVRINMHTVELQKSLDRGLISILDGKLLEAADIIDILSNCEGVSLHKKRRLAETVLEFRNFAGNKVENTNNAPTNQ